MSPFTLLGFVTLSCGCVVGQYRFRVANRVLDIVEEKGSRCLATGHRRNEPVEGRRDPLPIAPAVVLRKATGQATV